MRKKDSISTFRITRSYNCGERVFNLEMYAYGTLLQKRISLGELKQLVNVVSEEVKNYDT